MLTILESTLQKLCLKFEELSQRLDHCEKYIAGLRGETQTEKQEKEKNKNLKRDKYQKCQKSKRSVQAEQDECLLISERSNSKTKDFKLYLPPSPPSLPSSAFSILKESILHSNTKLQSLQEQLNRVDRQCQNRFQGMEEGLEIVVRIVAKLQEKIRFKEKKIEGKSLSIITGKYHSAKSIQKVKHPQTATHKRSKCITLF